MRISDWSSDVCSSDLRSTASRRIREARTADGHVAGDAARRPARAAVLAVNVDADADRRGVARARHRTEEHTYELQSLMSTSYAVVCLKKKIRTNNSE